jgi:calcium-dependent protein kinase
MGCIPSKSRQEPKQLSIKNPSDIKVSHGTFVQSNEKGFQEVYILGALQSTGSYGEMRKATHRSTKEERAVKIFRKDIPSYKGGSHIKQEIEILKKIDHPNIIKVFEFFEETKKLFVVMEHCKGGELFEEILKRQYFSEAQACTIIKQLFSAVSYLHSNNIIHRDLKPENILLEEKSDLMNIKIVDFAAATLYDKKTLLKGMLGTAYYIAPEVLTENYNEKCDMWSCGVIIFILLSGYPPFDGKTQSEILEKVKAGVYSFDEPIWANVSSEAKDLIQKLLSPVSTRLSSIEALNHPWLVRFAQKSQARAESIQSALNNLRTFHNSNKLRDAVHTYITTHCLNSQDIKDLREVFKAIDINGDGKLSREELIKHYEIYMGSDHAHEEVQKIMLQVDTDNNGFIDYTEFLKATLNQRSVMSSENLRKAFDLFDRDSSGSINALELKRVLGGGDNIDDKVWKQLISSVDQNADSEIDLREFEEVIFSNN